MRMKKIRLFVIAILLFVVSCTTKGMNIQQASWPEFENQAIQLISDYPTVDMHSAAGRPWLGRTWKDLYYPSGRPAKKPSKDKIAPSWRPYWMEQRLEGMKIGYLSTTVVAVLADFYVDADNPTRFASNPKKGHKYLPSYCFRCKNQFDYIFTVIDEDLAELALSPEDIKKAVKEGKQSIILAVAGGEILDGSIEKLDDLYNNGVRILELGHNHVNQLCDIQTASEKYNGLSTFGVEVVKKMNQLGMVIDVAHASFDTVQNVVDLTSDPIILSHTHIDNSRFSKPKRAITNEHAKLIASTGGVIGIWPNKAAATTFTQYIDQIMKAIEVVGVDHVGTGTDIDGMMAPSFWAAKWEVRSGKDRPYTRFPSIPAALLARGLSPSDVLKVTGGNFMRVFEQVTS